MQATSLEIADIELLHVKLRLQSLGAHTALASDELPGSLLGLAKIRMGLKLLPSTYQGEHWQWAALEAISRLDPVRHKFLPGIDKD